MGMGRGNFLKSGLAISATLAACAEQTPTGFEHATGQSESALVSSVVPLVAELAVDVSPEYEALVGFSRPLVAVDEGQSAGVLLAGSASSFDVRASLQNVVQELGQGHMSEQALVNAWAGATIRLSGQFVEAGQIALTREWYDCHQLAECDERLLDLAEYRVGVPVAHVPRVPLCDRSIEEYNTDRTNYMESNEGKYPVANFLVVGTDGQVGDTQLVTEHLSYRGGVSGNEEQQTLGAFFLSLSDASALSPGETGGAAVFDLESECLFGFVSQQFATSEEGERFIVLVARRYEPVRADGYDDLVLHAPSLIPISTGPIG